MATTTPDASLKTREEVLDSVVSLARLFSTTVEAFGKIHPRELNHNQQIALTCLGIEQGRLLIWGNAVGISSPPATIAKHMIPSRPGDFNPDPTAPVNFIPRDPRLDDPDVRTTVETCLRDLVDRPAHLPRVEMMRAFGLKQPRPNSQTAAPKTLDHNRLEGFREQFSILCDLVDEPASERRRMSIIMDDWIIHNAQQFSTFVQFAREHVDTLIALMDVQAQVDKGMETDIRTLGWHPTPTSTIIGRDKAKLNLIREACADSYPDYTRAAKAALAHISKPPPSANSEEPAPRSRESSTISNPVHALVDRVDAMVHRSSDQRRPTGFQKFKKVFSRRKKTRSDAPIADTQPTDPNSSTATAQPALSSQLAATRSLSVEDPRGPNPSPESAPPKPSTILAQASASHSDMAHPGNPIGVSKGSTPKRSDSDLAFLGCQSTYGFEEVNRRGEQRQAEREENLQAMGERSEILGGVESVPGGEAIDEALGVARDGDGPASGTGVN